MGPYSLPGRCVLASLLVLLLGTGGCLEGLCGPGDSTYTCCLKEHATNPAVCGASEKEAAEVLGQSASQGPSGASSRAKALAVGGTMVAAATLSSDDSVLTQELRTDVEKALKKCAELANELVNHRRLGGDPTRAQCEEVVGRDGNGNEVTRAMQLGEEKHAEARKCAEERLGGLLPGRFSLEQRYRYDPTTRQKELVSEEERQTLLRKGQGKKLKGTLVPDVVIHSGNPLEVQAVYDFKFPCLSTSLPKWTIYSEEGHPFRDRTQGSVYEEVFGVNAMRVTPWEFR